MNWKLWMIISGLVCLSIFVGQNYQAVEVRFLFWGFKTSRAIILFTTMGLGFILGWTACLLILKKNQPDSR